MRNKFNLEVTQTPKLHKNAIIAKFVIAAPKCSMRTLLKDLTDALKLIYKQTENYNFKKQCYAGVKTCWPVQSNRNENNEISEV